MLVYTKGAYSAGFLSWGSVPGSLPRAAPSWHWADSQTAETHRGHSPSCPSRCEGTKLPHSAADSHALWKNQSSMLSKIFYLFVFYMVQDTVNY